MENVIDFTVSCSRLGRFRYLPTGGIDVETVKEETRIAPAVFDLRELAKLLGTPYKTVWDQHKKGQIPLEGFRVGNRWLFRKSDVHKWLGISEPVGE